MRVSRTVVRIFGGALLLVLVLAGPAGAHDPIFVDELTAPVDSPIIGDGTISFATYGVITEPNRTAHVRLDLADGDTLHVEVLVPDQPPENERDDFSHLTLGITAPDGAVTQLPGGSIIDRYDERFTGTAYLRVAELDAPATTGTYELAITSTRPTRFTVATGRTEQFGTEVTNYQRRSLDAVTSWYTTPPPQPAPDTSPAPTSTTTTTAAPPPPSTGGQPTTPSTSATSSSEPDNPGTEVATASATESTYDADGGPPVAVLLAGVAVLLAAGWWLRRRASQR